MKVVFTSLGPDKEYTSADEQKFKDGDVAELNEVDYEKAVVNSKFAQDHTPDLEIKTKRLVASADKKRKEVMAKMEKLKK